MEEINIKPCPRYKPDSMRHVTVIWHGEKRYVDLIFMSCVRGIVLRCRSVFVPPRKCSGGTNSLADSFRPEQLRGKTYPRICSVNSVDCIHLEHCEIEFIVKQFLS